MRNLAFAFFALVLVSLTACSTMNLQTCKTADWQRVGYKDGREGRQVKDFRRDEQKCEDLGAPLNSDQYFKGYAMGITAYCTRANGMYVGSKGEDYKKQCPRSLESEFLTGYVQGKRDYDRNEIEKDRTDALSKALRESREESRNECSFNSDCKIKRSCDFSKCSDTGKKCSFDSDCAIEGSCDFGKCNF